jgi:hydroxymethylglutaryl-CoA lyase
MTTAAAIRITEVGPRDGLQAEAVPLSVEQKVAFIDRLSAAGAAEIEVASFVNPRRVPQMADAGLIFQRIARRPGVVYSALVPNRQGMDAALAAGADKVAVFTAASETFSRENTGATIAESLERCAAVIQMARGAGLRIRAYVSCVVECPYEGAIAPAAVRAVAGRLLDAGADEIDLGETIGVAAPSDIDRLYAGLGGLLAPGDTTLHLHDTRGTALACAARALELGVRSFDASCGGLGGCPFAPGAAGNLATEDLAYMLARMGYRTGLDLEAQIEAARLVEAALGRALPGRVFGAARSAPAPRPRS